jgi:hypothetical protein
MGPPLQVVQYEYVLCIHRRIVLYRSRSRLQRRTTVQKKLVCSIPREKESYKLVDSRIKVAGIVLKGSRSRLTPAKDNSTKESLIVNTAGKELYIVPATWRELPLAFESI